MIKIRKAAERGHTQIGWLDSRHSFSFGDYYDPKQMGFSVLRVSG
jgi:quercetin 2,3-dioxygenase